MRSGNCVFLRWFGSFWSRLSAEAAGIDFALSKVCLESVKASASGEIALLYYFRISERLKKAFTTQAKAINPMNNASDQAKFFCQSEPCSCLELLMTFASK